MPEFQNWLVVIKWTFEKVLFVIVFFPSYYWNKFACLKTLYIFVTFLSFILLDINFLFWNIDSNKFPYIYSQINAHNSLLLSNYLIKMSQYPSFHYTFSILFVTYLSFSWFSWKIPITASPEEFFFMDIEKPFTFFMVKKGIKSNHNNLLLFDYWPCS